MTQTLNRPPGRSQQEPEKLPPHPHYTLGTLVTLGVVGTLAAIVLAVIALTVTASRDSVDDSLVSAKVDAYLAEAGAGATVGDVIPALTPKSQLPVASEVNVAVAPNMPPPIERTSQAIVEVHFQVVEGVHAIDPTRGVETETWGYRLLDGPDGIVVGTPGPVIRARVGDVLRFTITNPSGNTHPHNVDFHSVTGQGGGAEATIVAPGETATIEARLLYPGFFMYHCAYGDIASHISHGMFGGILVEPETPLPAVDHEWYIVQSEYYTDSTNPGVVNFDRRAVTDESPSFVVFNGAVGSLTGDGALNMNVGERARIYFVNAGLNLVSNLHPIGSHWDKVYQEATFFSPPLRGSQTTPVPAGGATVFELVGFVPADLILVDHALARALDKGALGIIHVHGQADHEIYEAITGEAPGGGHGTPPATSPGGSTGEVAAVTILEGSGTFAEIDAPDQFADNEDPGDYAPNVLRIKVGTTVTWTNQDSMMHTVTAVDGSFDSGFLNTGETWSHTFEEPGEWEYYCLPHPWMRAKVIVEP